MGRLAFSGLVFACACYAPAPQPGAPCANGACPSGLTCSDATQTCELPGTNGAPDAPTRPIDAADGSELPPPDARACFGSGIVTICLPAPVTTPLSIVNATTIDTDSSPSCIPAVGGNAYCVVAGSTVTVSQTLTAVGSRPLVVLAVDTLQVAQNGSISVASRLGQPAGAGAQPASCVAPTAATGIQGGAGGSFSGRGGRGADLESPNGPLAAVAVPAPVTVLRGGCKGGDGAGDGPGSGGQGGGAVYVIAGTSITINGTLTASGAGGAGATSRGGGGGGGAGGMIGLDAPTVTVAATGRVFANGGAGGEGGTQNSDGRNGGDAVSATMVANGGNAGAEHGGNGGNGTTGSTRDAAAGAIGNQCTGAGPQNGRGGGGGAGGGGAGVVRVFAVTSTLTGPVSPPAN